MKAQISLPQKSSSFDSQSAMKILLRILKLDQKGNNIRIAETLEFIYEPLAFGTSIMLYNTVDTFVLF